MLNRYTLFYKGTDSPQPDALEQIRRKATVLESSRKVVLVEATGEAMTQLASDLPDWVVEAEYIYPIPTTRPNIRKPL